MSDHSTETPASVSEKELLPIGYLSKAHGIRGELAFVLTAESPEFVAGTVFLRHKNGGSLRPFTLIRKRRHHGCLLVTFEGVTTRREAELLRSHTVFASRNNLPPPKEGGFFLSELSGFKVFTVNEAGTESELGVIKAALAPAGQTVWSIRTPDGREVLFPAVEEFVLSLDGDRNIARIAPPPGLLDLYLGAK